jgi:hypothetical protein
MKPVNTNLVCILQAPKRLSRGNTSRKSTGFLTVSSILFIIGNFYYQSICNFDVDIICQSMSHNSKYYTEKLKKLVPKGCSTLLSLKLPNQNVNERRVRRRPTLQFACTLNTNEASRYDGVESDSNDNHNAISEQSRADDHNKTTTITSST